MIKTILATVLLILLSSGCVGTITNKTIVQDSSAQRKDNIVPTAKGINNSTINQGLTKKIKP